MQSVYDSDVLPVRAWILSRPSTSETTSSGIRNFVAAQTRTTAKKPSKIRGFTGVRAAAGRSVKLECTGIVEPTVRRFKVVNSPVRFDNGRTAREKPANAGAALNRLTGRLFPQWSIQNILRTIPPQIGVRLATYRKGLGNACQIAEIVKFTIKSLDFSGHIE
jgi:hypothetical protein